MKILTAIKGLFGGRSEGFSDFFLRASAQEKKQVFRQAAEKANMEQREIFEKSELETKVR